MSFENCEGTSWKEIKIPKSYKAISCSCSPNGDLWIITCEGKILMRTNITNQFPYGQDWNILNPYPNSIFVQITTSLNLVYALDTKGNAFLLNNDNYEWIKVLKDLSFISISISNKVFF